MINHKSDHDFLRGKVILGAGGGECGPLLTFNSVDS
jgi:hypothetical protein